jgi:hypothetical protein
MINSSVWFGSVFFNEKLIIVWLKTIKLNHFNNSVRFGFENKEFSSIIMNFENSLVQFSSRTKPYTSLVMLNPIGHLLTILFKNLCPPHLTLSMVLMRSYI